MGRVGGMDQMSLSVPLRNSDPFCNGQKKQRIQIGLDLCPCPESVRGWGSGGGCVWWGGLSLLKIPEQGRNSDGSHHILSLSGPLFLSWAMMELPRECAQNADSQAPARCLKMDCSGRGLRHFILTTACGWDIVKACSTTLPGSSRYFGTPSWVPDVRTSLPLNPSPD